MVRSRKRNGGEFPLHLQSLTERGEAWWSVARGREGSRGVAKPGEAWNRRVEEFLPWYGPESEMVAKYSPDRSR